MILYNVWDLSKQIFFGNPVDDSMRLFLARAVIDSAVEIFNYPATEDKVITELLEPWEDEYSVLGLDQLIVKVINEIKRKTRSYGWDPRCFAKTEYMGPTDGKGMLMARVVMDLEETFAKITAEITPVPVEDSIGEVVSDNPNMETLNELSQTRIREASRDFSLLSGRSQPFVRNNEEKGWRTVDWDRKGGF